MYSLHKVTVIVNGNEYTIIMPPGCCYHLESMFLYVDHERLKCAN